MVCTIEYFKSAKVVVVSLSEAQGCYEFKINFRRVARSVYNTELELAVEFFYVDFTDDPEDAILNVCL